VGTTESIYQGDPADVRPLPHEQDYLMKTLLNYFPRYRSEQHILSAIAGLRVLPSGGGQNRRGASSINTWSRETILHTGRQDPHCLLTIYGGKLTTYRLTAERVMARMIRVLPVRKVIADTRYLKLY